MIRKVLAITMATAAICFAASSTSEAAITKVAKRLNVLEFYGGYAHPVGSYDGIDIIDFLDSQDRLVELDADQVYDPGFYFGFNYGQLRSNHILVSLGFRWTHINTLDTFYTDPLVPNYGWAFVPETPTFNLYDLDLNVNYFFLDPSVSVVAPYVGLGAHAGILSVSGDLIETENDLKFAMGLNFGADFTFWKAPGGRSMMALSSVNEWVVAGSIDRPKYLNFGAALKYYFRP
ncbi:MAG: hypothetical protein AB1483_07130 [Candidatus Zixiibacteriota bacterium]